MFDLLQWFPNIEGDKFKIVIAVETWVPSCKEEKDDTISSHPVFFFHFTALLQKCRKNKLMLGPVFSDDKTK